MVIIALAYLNNRPTSRERYLLVSALLVFLIKLLSYLYTSASVILSFYLFIGIHNILPYENWHIKKLPMYRQLKLYCSVAIVFQQSTSTTVIQLQIINNITHNKTCPIYVVDYYNTLSYKNTPRVDQVTVVISQEPDSRSVRTGRTLRE